MSSDNKPDIGKTFVESLVSGPARWVETQTGDAHIGMPTTHTYTTVNPDGTTVKHMHTEVPGGKLSGKEQREFQQEMKQQQKFIEQQEQRLGSKISQQPISSASYADRIPANEKQIPPVGSITKTYKGEICTHPGESLIPGTMTTVAQGKTMSGQPTHIIQPHETIVVKGNPDVKESTVVHPLNQVDMRLHETSSRAGYLVHEKPVYVVKEKPVYVDRPVYIEKPVEKPVVIEKTIDRPVYVEKIVEKPVVIEKTIERPVYIVHETPGVVVGREVNVRDTTKTLSTKEVESFARKHGIVHDSEARTYIAPPELISDPRLLQQSTTTTGTSAAWNTTSQRSHSPAEYADKDGNRLLYVPESEAQRFFNKSEVLPKPVTSFNESVKITKEHPTEKRGFWSWLFGTSKKQEEPITIKPQDRWGSNWTQAGTTYSGQSGTNWQLPTREFAPPYQRVSAPSQGTTYQRTFNESRPWFFGDGVQRPSTYAGTPRDPTYLPTSGILENSSTSAAEHYYRFGTMATVDHPTNPLDLDLMVQNQRKHLGLQTTPPPPPGTFQQQQSSSGPWISQQSASNDWHTQNLYIDRTGEIVRPSLTHASLTELGQNIRADPANNVNPPGYHIQRGVDSFERGVDRAVENTKQMVTKTVDGAVDLVDKGIDKAQDMFDTAKEKISDVKQDRFIEQNRPIESNYWWKD